MVIADGVPSSVTGGGEMKKLTLLVVTTALVGCGTPQPGSSEFNVLATKKIYEARVEAVKTTASDLPDWYVSPPKSGDVLFATGSAISSDLQLAVDKAIMAAKRSLADQVAGSLSTKHKEYASEDGQLVSGTTERVTSNAITQVVLSGYSITERKVVADGAAFRAYVLARYAPSGAARSITTATLIGPAPAVGAKAATAFEELDRDINAAGVNPLAATVTRVPKVTKAVRIDDPRTAEEIRRDDAARGAAEPPSPAASPVPFVVKEPAN